MFIEYSAVENKSSEVISKIIAITASQRLISDNVNGKFICLTF
ncbi:MAG: hypothetical protein QXK18_05030 [Candidatus Bathyarchaeia archaeon]